MSKTSFIIDSNAPMFLEEPFSKFITDEGSVIFNGGMVLDLNNNRYNLNNFELVPENMGEQIEITENGEFYLQIKFKAGSSKIEFCKILNDEQLAGYRKNSDDMLNIFLPVARMYNGDEFSGEKSLSSNFLSTRTGFEKPLNAYYEDEKAKVMPFLLKSQDDFLINTFKPQEVSMQSSVLVIKFSGEVNILDGGGERFKEFILNDISLLSEEKKSCSITKNDYIKIFSDEEEVRNMPFEFKFPIGEIVDGNYVYLKRGNVKLSIKDFRLKYFKEIDEDVATGAKTPVYNEKVTTYVYPEFV